MAALAVETVSLIQSSCVVHQLSQQVLDLLFAGLCDWFRYADRRADDHMHRRLPGDRRSPLAEEYEWHYANEVCKFVHYLAWNEWRTQSVVCEELALPKCDDWNKIRPAL